MKHWPEYLTEGVGLGLFMLAACAFGSLLEHPASPVRQALPDAALRRGLMGVAMGLTSISLIYSPWGKQSGAHFNPALTFTFWRLGRIAGRDALAYVAAQFAGGILGVLLAAALLRGLPAHPAVNHVTTLPGPAGPAVAFLAEVAIAFGLMTTVIRLANHPRLGQATGLCCGALVAAYILFEAPLSGMSMNPARTLGSAVAARQWAHLWIYFAAPPLGMLLAAAVHRRLPGAPPVRCAKLHHQNDRRCIFCDWRARWKAAGTFSRGRAL